MVLCCRYALISTIVVHVHKGVHTFTMKESNSFHYDTSSIGQVFTLVKAFLQESRLDYSIPVSHQCTAWGRYEVSTCPTEI